MMIRLVACVATLGAAVSIAGCGGESAASGEVKVMASTNVWGSVATAVGGDLVQVTSIVSDPAADPHSYQLTPRDASALIGADLVVFNGGGYDEFIYQALEPGPRGPATVEAFTLTELPRSLLAGTGSAVEVAHGGNEHIWYHLPTVAAVANAIADQLAELRPEAAETFRANAKSFREQVDGLVARVDRMAGTGADVKVAATEPVAHYLLETAGLEDVTPTEFVEAVEEETDPPAAAVAKLHDLVASRQVSLLVHNPQTETPVVADVLAKARATQLPVVELTETLPPGQDYLTWMNAQIESLSAAVTRR